MQKLLDLLSKNKYILFPFALEIINNTPLGSSELKKIKQDIYCYDLIQYCLLVLSQDCSRIQGGWSTISQLTQILR